MTTERERLIAAGVIRPQHPDRPPGRPGFLYQVEGVVRGSLPTRGNSPIASVEIAAQEGRNALGDVQPISARVVAATPTIKVLEAGFTNLAPGDRVKVLIPLEASRWPCPLIFVRRDKR